MRICPVCHHQKNKQALHASSHILYRCLSCSTVFLSPRPKRSEAIEKNTEVYDGKKTLETFQNMEQKMRKRAQRQVDMINTLSTNSPAKKVLDIGCSYGYALSVFQDHGYIPYGIDISPVSVRFLQEHHGIQGEVTSFESFQTQQTYDVITMFDVIEHLVDPRAAIQKAHSLLNPGGILLLQTPNYDSLIRKITGRQWYWLLLPWHLTLFTPSSLHYLLEQSGYTVVHTKTWDDMYEVGSNLLDILGIRREGNHRLFHRRASKIFSYTLPLSFFWNQYLLGGEIEMYAKK